MPARFKVTTSQILLKVDQTAGKKKLDPNEQWWVRWSVKDGQKSSLENIMVTIGHNKQ